MYSNRIMRRVFMPVGKKISMVKVASTSVGIDTPEDLKRAIEIFL